MQVRAEKYQGLIMVTFFFFKEVVKIIKWWSSNNKSKVRPRSFPPSLCLVEERLTCGLCVSCEQQRISGSGGQVIAVVELLGGLR